MTVSEQQQQPRFRSPAETRAAAKDQQQADRAPQRSRSRAKPKTRRSLRAQIEQLVTLINMPIAIIAPIDALDPIEQGALVDAIDKQAQASPRFHRTLEALLSVTSTGNLPLVAGIIVARRAARHGAFGGAGQFVDGMGGQVLAMTNAKPSEQAEAMESIVGIMRGMQPDDVAGDNGQQPNAATSA